jgi:hypothetical protein
MAFKKPGYFKFFSPPKTKMGQSSFQIKSEKILELIPK